MRLIDLDEFAKLSRRWVPDLSTIEEATNENDIWDLGYLECIKVIDACYVYENLIPIEWIEKWGWKNGMSESMSLRVMIDDWEKENE